MSLQDTLSSNEGLVTPRPMEQRLGNDLDPVQANINQALYNMTLADPELKEMFERYAAQFVTKDPAPAVPEMVVPDTTTSLNAAQWSEVVSKLAQSGAPDA